MKHLKKSEFESVMESGMDLILFFYLEEDAASILGRAAMEETERLIGKNFDLYLINILSEPEICEAFTNAKNPEFISMKNRKIYKRSTELLSSGKILDLLK